jgi:hypothetical protein
MWGKSGHPGHYLPAYYYYNYYPPAWPTGSSEAGEKY